MANKYIRFKDALKAARKAAGMKQSEVAKIAGVSSAYLSRIESELSLPGNETLWKLCHLFGWSLHEMWLRVELERCKGEPKSVAVIAALLDAAYPTQED